MKHRWNFGLATPSSDLTCLHTESISTSIYIIAIFANISTKITCLLRQKHLTINYYSGQMQYLENIDSFIQKRLTNQKKTMTC